MKWIPSAVVFAGLALWAQGAGAVTITIGAQPGGSGAITQLATGSGGASYTGTTAYGNIVVASANGTGSPPLPAPSLLDSNTIDVSSTAAGKVYVYVTASDITAPIGTLDFTTSFTANGAGNGALPATWSVVLASYVDTTNHVFSTSSLLAQECFGAGPACGNAVTTGVNVGSGPYSVTALYEITTTGAGSGNLTIDIAAVATPLPPGLPLLGTVLAGLGFLGWKRRNAASAA